MSKQWYIVGFMLIVATVATAAPLQVDLSQDGDVQEGWIDWNTNGDKLGNDNISRQFLDEATFDEDFTIDFISVDSRNRGDVPDNVPLHDVLEDALKESGPFDMVIRGLDRGLYTLTTYHHDPKEDAVNDDGTINITVTDADGTRVVADHLQQSWGPVPQVLGTATFTIRSDGEGDITLTFEDNNDGIHNEAYLNGFELDIKIQRDKAVSPSPDDRAADVLRDVVLAWIPGESTPATNGHKVFFSTEFVDVNDGLSAAEQGVTSAAQFVPEALEFGTTYYWRVDEVNLYTGWTEGDVWSFTTEPHAYLVPADAITATASSTYNATMGPDKTIDGSGLSEDGGHSDNEDDMWLSANNGPEPAWIQYEFDKAYLLDTLCIWNFNHGFEPVVGFGLKSVVIEYSADGVTWDTLTDGMDLAQAAGAPGYTDPTTVEMNGLVAKVIKITPKSSWGDRAQYGLSEVQFTYVPMRARYPQPATGDVAGPEVDLAWRGGRDAVSHEVSMDVDAEAVRTGQAVIDVVTDWAYAVDGLMLATTYYWRVDAINEDETPAVWTGDIWSFTTPDFVAVDDFDSYTDDLDAGEAIFQTWIDGWENGTGATVGYLISPFAERTIVHSGWQSLPLQYDNTVSPYYSEAERTFDNPQDWTASGVGQVRYHVHGAVDNAVNGADALYLVIEDAQGNAAVLPSADAAVIVLDDWQEFTVDLGAASAEGVDLTAIEKIYFGIGDRDNPVAGGAGTVYVDDVRLYPNQ